MATVNATVIGPTDDGLYIVQWPNMALNDVGAAVEVPFYTADKTVQVNGTFGAAGAVTMQGANLASPGAGDWGSLHDVSIAALVIGTVAPMVIAETPRWIRPNVTAGDGTTDVTVTIVAPVRGK